jgi:glycosyltransferase involved in cell wall biosynthesis
MKNIKTSLVITTYNWPEALELVLASVQKQTTPPDEVIIADDGRTSSTKKIIQEFSQKSAMQVIHSWQEDDGFRAAMSRNKAIAKANYEYIVLIDGDMILHPSFIEDHVNFAKKNSFVQGVRAKISSNGALSLFIQKNFNFKPFDPRLKSKRYSLRSKLLSLVFSGRRYFKKLKMLLSCNMAFFKDDFIRVNGFNEDFIGWGREDSEFAARLIHSGLYRRDLRFSAVAYHIHHEGNSREMFEKNHAIYLETVNQKISRCKNGVDKYLVNLTV